MSNSVSRHLLSLAKNRDTKKVAYYFPSLSSDYFLGLSNPEIAEIKRKIPKEDILPFLQDLPHAYYEEMIIHILLITKTKDISLLLQEIDKLLPFLCCWGETDKLASEAKIFRRQPQVGYEAIKRYLADGRIYVKRLGIVLLLSYYMDENFQTEQMEIVSSIVSDDYYLDMAIAWYFSYGLIKQYESTVGYFEERILSHSIHQKSIQKAIDSFRVSPERKNYLKTLRYKKEP
ncbi:MAG TPA: DNA alkylation repair protein [Bacilli bacterium]|nr:DNA alkylation repair protein [Bacilli bacterium]